MGVIFTEMKVHLTVTWDCIDKNYNYQMITLNQVQQNGLEATKVAVLF